MKELVVVWKPIEYQGMEYLSLRDDGEGMRVESAVIAVQDGGALRLDYVVECDASYRVRAVQVKLAGRAALALTSDGHGNWFDEKRDLLPDLQGCLDIDLSATPFTNTLPIKRIAWKPGQSETLRMVFDPGDDRPRRRTAVYLRGAASGRRGLPLRAGQHRFPRPAGGGRGWAGAGLSGVVRADVGGVRNNAKTRRGKDARRNNEMENPLMQPQPNDPSDKIHAFALDLAYGAVHEDWSPRLVFDEDGNWVADPRLRGPGLYTHNQTLFCEKWHKQFAPDFSLLISFGYLEKLGERGERRTGTENVPYIGGPRVPPHLEIEYVLTQKCFSLLAKPTTPPSIFISHKQDQSSALALLIEARLKLQDSNIGVFIDRDIPPGEKWNGFLEDRVKESQFFICLLTIETLASMGVDAEIQWAFEWAKENPDLKIIPICHNGYNFAMSYPSDRPKARVISEEMIQALSEWQAILVEEEKAEHYDFAILKLLNRLGYSVVK